MKHLQHTALQRVWRPAKSSHDTSSYLNFLNVPVLAGCVGAWAVVLLVGAALSALF